VNHLPSFQQLAKVADAVVRVVALLIVASALVPPLLVIQLAGLFSKGTQEYADALLARMIELFKTILDGSDHSSGSGSMPPGP